nr:AAA family ATPase [Lachnospiraceae bacterium]
MNHDNDLQYEYFSSIRQRTVEWLWYPYIPYGKLTVLQGDPGEGKSTFMLNIAALLTRGKDMPDGFPISGPQQVVYQTAEDNLADTVKPRLIAANADCSRIAYIIDEDEPLTIEDARIEKVIRSTQARLFILDPLQAYLSSDSDMFFAGKMRQMLKKLADIGAKYNCAMVLIGHMNKASGEKNLYRGLGSIDIAAIARSILMIARDKDDPSIRYMFPVKSSLAPEGTSIAFSFDPVLGLKWIGRCQIDHVQLAYSDVGDNKKNLAKRIIKDLLEFQDVHSSDILFRLKTMGISERTIQTAKKELGVSSSKRGDIWFWHLDAQTTDKE